MQQEQRKKILFIDHSYHKKTASNRFFSDYLNEYFDIDFYYDENWKRKNRKNDNINISNKYYAIILFQNLPNKSILKQLIDKNVIFVPMYDAVQNWDIFKWNKVKNFKILCFSKTIYNLLAKYGFNTLFIQYYTKTDKFSYSYSKTAFLWQRVTSINFYTIKKLVGKYLEKVHIHKSIDPNHNEIKIAEDDIKKYNITISEWFETREEFNNVIKNHEIFIAPRFTEGIGLPVLEAMAMGKAVIANDAPTMNEYIQHGVNGYLADFRNPKPVDFSDIENIKKNAYKSSKEGYEKWLSERSSIIDFINQPYKKHNKKLTIFFIKDFIKNLFSVTKNNGYYVLRILFFKLKL